MATPSFDIAVIGGGIVGVATAWSLSRHGRYHVSILEAEPRLAQHQSGRNSGVIHSGLYYRPGSAKARMCLAGRDRLYRFCEQRQIPHHRCGKLVVATEPSELSALAELAQRAAANGLEGVERVDAEEMRRREPAVRGIAGLWVPQAGVVDFAAVTRALASEVRGRRGEVFAGARVQRIVVGSQGIDLATRDHHRVRCRLLVNCAGLHCDRVARLAGLDPEIRLVPFRGEYFEITGDDRDRVGGLIYPVPDVRLPFLGIHLTRTVDGRLLAGPNAVLAFKREGYRRSDFSLRDVAEMLSFPGSWRMARRFWRPGLAEIRRSLDRRAFVTDLQRLVPAIGPGSLRQAASGVRAQAVDRSGNLLDDFHVMQRDRMIHVLNAPSPAATAALAIGDHIARLAEAALG